MLPFLFHTGSIKSRSLSETITGCQSFYSILVRLKAPRRVAEAARLPRFYSILVRLKAKTWNAIEIVNIKFLFHTGSIKSKEAYLILHGENPSFYSILVRLKVYRRVSWNVNSVVFLFHTGSIKRKYSRVGDGLHWACFYSILVRLKDREGESGASLRAGFYSILVRLKVAVASSLFHLHTGFYSILVRLKGTWHDLTTTLSREFLFHTGSIKRMDFLSI